MNIARRLRAAFLLLALCAVPALADTGVGVMDTIVASIITTASGNCLPVDKFRKSLTLDATAALADIGWCEYTASAASCAAALGTAGTTNLGHGVNALAYWTPGGAPQNGFCFVAASGSQPMTIRAGY